MKNIDVFDFLDRRFPIGDAMDFDNVGFLVGEREASVKRVLVTLDCDRTAVERAIKEHCELIVTHHPVIFDGLKSVTENDTVYRLIKNGISVISMHTNLDVGAGGVNDCLCAAVGFDSVDSFTADDGYTLRRGTLSGISADEFAASLHKSLGGCVKYTDGGKPISRVLVCSGSGGNYFRQLRTACCDALLSADIKHNVFIDAVNQGFSVFDAGHFATEDVVVEPLASAIREQFSVLDVITHHPNNIRFA